MKKIRHPYVLTLVCVYETVRQTRRGPTFDELQTLLQNVYNLSLDVDSLKKAIAALEKNHIQLNQADARYYPVMGGVFLFSAVQHRIIPPQTVAQPERRRRT